MSKALKKILTTSAAFVMLAGVGAGISSLSNNVHAAYREEDQYESSFNKLIPGTRRHGPIDHNFYKHGYLFNVYTVKQQLAHGRMGDLDPIVVGIDGDTHVSNSQVWAALRGHRVNLHRHARHHYGRRHARRHTRRHARRHYRRHGHRRY